MPICCCFGRSRRRKQAYLADAHAVPNGDGRERSRPATHEHSKQASHEDLDIPLSRNSFLSEYHDAQENFSVAEGCSPCCSADNSPRLSAELKHVGPGPHHQDHPHHHPQYHNQGQHYHANESEDVYNEPRGILVGTSDTSEEASLAALQGGGPMAKLASCLTILESIIPGAGTGTGFGGSGATGPGLAAAAGAEGGDAAAAHRTSGKLIPGSTIQRRDMSQSVLDVREAYSECDASPCLGPTPSASTLPSLPACERPVMVRGPDYLRSRTKVPATGSMYRLLAADVISGDTKLTHVARRVALGGLLAQAHGQQGAADGGSGAAAGADPHLPSVLIVTIMLPIYQASLFGANDGPSQSLVYYFGLPPGFNAATFPNQKALGLLRRLVTNGREADGSSTRDRFKLIPRVVNVDEWAAKGPLSPPEHRLLTNYNDKPLLTRPQHYFFTGPGYLEIDIDIHVYQFLARRALGAFITRLREVVYDNSFVIQGNAAEELPEQVLGAVRMYRIDFEKQRPLQAFISPAPQPAAAATADGAAEGTGAAPSPAPARSGTPDSSGGASAVVDTTAYVASVGEGGAMLRGAKE